MVFRSACPRILSRGSFIAEMGGVGFYNGKTEPAINISVYFECLLIPPPSPEVYCKSCNMENLQNAVAVLGT